MLKVAVLFYAVEFAAALILPRLLGGTAAQQGVWRFIMMFPNVGFIGYPVVVALFGQEALFYAVILVMPFNLLAFTLGPLMLTGARRFSLKQMFTPAVIASVIALVLALARIRLPALVGECLDFVGDVTVPLSLLVVGSLLAGLPARQVMASLRLWLLAAVRLLGLPVLIWLILKNMNISTLILRIAVIQMAMPGAVNGSLLCLEHGGDSETMAQAVFLTTLLSIVTIPLVTAILL